MNRFDNYVFELDTMIEKYLAQTRIHNYLSLVFKDQGLGVANVALDYIVVVRARVMLMKVCYHTFKNEEDDVRDALSSFNEDFETYVSDFKRVTGSKYEPGREVSSSISNAQAHLPSVRKKDTASTKLDEFLLQHGLQDLQQTLKSQEVDIEDLMEMTHEEMKSVGIRAFRQRRLIMSLLQNEGKKKEE